MLVLTRREGEKIQVFVGDELVTVCLIEARRSGKARIGIEASDAVRIVRDELLQGGLDARPREQ